MNIFTVYPNQLANWSPYTFYKEAFSKAECEKIISLFVSPKKALVGPGEGKAESIRSTEVCFIDFNQDTHWIFQRLLNFALPCNQQRYGFQLSNFMEGLQLTKYSGKGDHYDWHIDSGPQEQSRRKLSMVVQLSHPDDYTGCELQMLNCPEKVPNSRGDLIVFPSYYPHKVSQLETGTRFSLVVWISGEPYR